MQMFYNSNAKDLFANQPVKCPEADGFRNATVFYVSVLSTWLKIKSNSQYEQKKCMNTCKLMQA